MAYDYELFPDGRKEMSAHIVITSYEAIVSDDSGFFHKRGLYWKGLIVDEAQRLKNDQSLLYLALRKMKFPFKLLLTGNCESHQC